MVLRPWLNWIEHLTTDQKVEGSNPSGRAMNSKTDFMSVFNLSRSRSMRTRNRVRQQVDFGSKTHQNRYGCRAGIYAERILLGAP